MSKGQSSKAQPPKKKPETKRQRIEKAEALDALLDADKKSCSVCGASIGAALMSDHMLLAHGR